MSAPAPDSSAWTVLHRAPLLSAPPWLAVSRETVRLPAGKVIPDFYRVDLPDFALVVPFTGDGRTVLVRGYRHGVGDVSLGPPGGIVGPGEGPLDAARRELLEETGYAADDWQQLGAYVVDANRHCGTMHAFVAHGARLVRPSEPEDTESLETCLLTRQELAAALERGDVHGLAAACALGLALLRAA